MSHQTFVNPLLWPNGPDPWLMFHEGFYYLAVTSVDHIALRKAASLLDIGAAVPVEVWRDPTPRRSQMMWAPEFYFLDGRWYCYYTASDSVDDNHRCFALESAGADPLGPYHFKAQLLTDARDEFYAIDGSVVQTSDGRRYFLWAGKPGHRLYASTMENPWTLRGERQLIPADGFGCQEVREGPICLCKNGKVWLVYSICDTGKPDYKLGMLWADESADLSDAANWKQWPRPVFERCDEHGVFGPGHHSFFRSPDNSEDWICYHAKTVKAYTYCGRTPRTQRFEWHDDGFPVFGVPLDLQTPIELPSGDPKA